MLTSPGRFGAVAVMVRRAALAAAASALGGCYAQTPLTSLPAPGTDVVVELNDAGRVAMAAQVGPSVTSIEGVLDSTSLDSAFTLSVTSVSVITGAVARWSGEPVKLRPAFVQTMYERRLSKGRTAVFAAGLAVGATVFVVTHGLGILGGAGNEAPPPGQGGNSNSLWAHP
ncbi:MAG TPA: hypothetical protein VMT21_04655 [Gemmatimonadales bacterium]|nr:hypothetical protein [Gemmatimonadales bacterium]